MGAIGKQYIPEHGRLWAIENLISGFMARFPSLSQGSELNLFTEPFHVPAHHVESLIFLRPRKKVFDISKIPLI